MRSLPPASQKKEPLLTLTQGTGLRMLRQGLVTATSQPVRATPGNHQRRRCFCVLCTWSVKKPTQTDSASVGPEVGDEHGSGPCPQERPTTATPGGPSLHAPQPAPSPPACNVQYLRAVQARRAARGSWGRAARPYPRVLSAALCPSSHRPIQLPGCVLWLPLAADRALPGICPAPWQAPPKRGGPGGLCATEPRWPPLTQASGSWPGPPCPPVWPHAPILPCSRGHLETLPARARSSGSLGLAFPLCVPLRPPRARPDGLEDQGEESGHGRRPPELGTCFLQVTLPSPPGTVLRTHVPSLKSEFLHVRWEDLGFRFLRTRAQEGAPSRGAAPSHTARVLCKIHLLSPRGHRLFLPIRETRKWR